MRVEVGEAVAVDVDGRRVDEQMLGGRIARRVLAILALDQRPMPRDVVAHAVWGPTPPASWETALRGAIHRIRRAATPELVVTAFGCYQLGEEATVDLLAAIGSLADAEAALREGDPTRSLALADVAASILDTPFLPGEDGEWFEERRRELAASAVRARLVESMAATSLGDHLRAIAAAEAALRHDRYHEEVHRRLMAAHAAAGNRADALVAYRRCREILAEDLGVDPSPVTEAAYVSLLGDEPPPGPAAVAPSSLPPTLDRATALCGREADLEAVRGHLDAAMRGASRFVVVTGGSGVGKSRFVAEVATLAHRAGASVVHGRFDPDAAAPYAALSEAFGQLGVAWPPPMTTPGFLAEPGRLLADAREVIDAATAAGPLVLVVDDLHWGDRASVRVLDQLVRPDRPTPLLVLATARDDIVSGPLAELAAAPADARRAAIALGHLDRQGVEALVTAWAGDAAGDELVAWLVERSGGNPFFAHALLHDVSRRQAALPAGAGRLSAPADDVRAVGRLVADVAEHLGPVVEQVLDAGAVIGPDFRVDDVEACTGLSASDVLTALDAAARARLIGQSAIDPGRFCFAHSLVRDSRLDSLDAPARRGLHAAAAEALARRAPRSPDLVRHLLAAGEPGMIERAARVAVAVNEDLLDSGAAETARDLLVGVLGALDVGKIDAPAERASVLAALAAARMMLREVPLARDHLRAAARIAIDLGNPEVLKPVQAAFLAPAVAGGADVEMIDLVEGLLALAPGAPMRVALLCWLGMELFWSPDAPRGVEAVDEALETARGLRDPFLFLLTAHAWHFINRLVHPEARQAVIHEAEQCYQRLGHPLSVQMLVYSTVDHLELGDRLAAVDTARQAARQMLVDDETSYYPWLLRRTDVMLATIEGRLDDADRLGDELAAMTGPLESEDAQLQLVIQTLARRYHQGRLAELHPLVAAFANRAGAPPFARCVNAWVEVEIGAASAEASVDSAVAAAASMPRDLNWKPVVAVVAEAAAKIGHPAADETARLLEPWSGLHVITNTVLHLGAVDRYLALGAAAAGDLDRAVDLGERALVQHRALGSPPYVARSAVELAAMLDRRASSGDADRAVTLRTEAVVLASTYGLGAA